MTARGPYPPIEAHGVVGDLQTAALVATDGTVDFLCLPRFDSPSVFASLLDCERGGRFELRPELADARHRQLYLPDTNVLLTRFLAPQGVAEISDFMPVHAELHPSRVVRRVKTVRGQVRYQVRCAPRFGYALTAHRAEAVEGGVLFTSDDGLVLRLSTPVPLEVEEGDADGTDGDSDGTDADGTDGDGTDGTDGDGSDADADGADS